MRACNETPGGVDLALEVLVDDVPDDGSPLLGHVDGEQILVIRTAGRSAR